METGVAYFANRLLSHVRADMRNTVEHNCTYVLHCFTENDMIRHREIMKDIVRITHEFGLTVWMDSWGLGKVFAGDVSGFCGDYPEARQVLSDGTPIAKSCLYAPEFREYIKTWTDAVAATGSEAVFWDEPNMAFFDGNPPRWGCRCERCRNLFRDKYDHDMPTEMTPEVIDFRHQSVLDFLDFATRNAHTKGLKNVVCCMIAKDTRFGDKNWEDIIALPAVDNFGTDPYCHGNPEVPSIADYYAHHTARTVKLCNQFGKDHHLWVQAFGIGAGCEKEIVDSTIACRDAGAQNIAAWGYAGCEGNDYRCANPEAAWAAVGEAFRRVRW